MKKRNLLALLLISATLLVGCSGGNVNEDEDKDDKEKQVEKDTDKDNDETSDKDNEEIEESPLDDFEWEITDKGVTITIYKGNDKEVKIPSIIENRMVTDVASTAFGGNVTIEKIIMPEHMTYVSAALFTNCPSLTYLDCPGATGASVYKSLENLKTLKLPSVKEFEVYDILDCKSLESLDLSSAEIIIWNQLYQSETERFPKQLKELTISDEMLNGCYEYTGGEYGDPILKLNADQSEVDNPTPITSDSILLALEWLGMDSITINGTLYTK